MELSAFRSKSSFSKKEFQSFMENEILDVPNNFPKIENGLNQWVDEINHIEFNSELNEGKIIGTYYITPKDPHFIVHFGSDSVLPGYAGIMAARQLLTFFTAWAGLYHLRHFKKSSNCSFNGQFRPFDNVMRIEINFSLDDIESPNEVRGKVLILSDKHLEPDKYIEQYSIKEIILGAEFSEVPKLIEFDLDFDFKDDLSPLKEKFTNLELETKGSYSSIELLAHSKGQLRKFNSEKYACLPLPFMDTIDFIPKINWVDGVKGTTLIAVKNLDYKSWAFQSSNQAQKTYCHELMIDAFWQALGFILSCKMLGTGRAIGYNSLKVFNNITQEDSQIIYCAKVKKCNLANSSKIYAEGVVYNQDKKPIIFLKQAKVGMYQDIKYPNFPVTHDNMIGGREKT